MAVHVSEVSVESFRGLRGLRLEGLNDINILTGDNNSGKTSVLELLSTLAGPSTFEAWRSCARPSTRARARRMYFEEFYSLFPVDDARKRVAYGVIMSGCRHSVSLEAELYEAQLSSAEIDFISGLPKGLRSEDENQDKSATRMELRSIVDGITSDLGEIYDFQFLIRRQRPVATELAGHIAHAVYVPAFAHASGGLPIRDSLLNDEAYEDLLAVVREFDPDVTAITAVPSEHPGMTPDFRVLSRGHGEGMPLASYGDGMKKAVMLCSQAIRARGGLLLVDEFETAIHTSAMSPTFSVLLRTALRVGAQVIMTTHSKEAIEKVLDLGGGLEDHINLYTLYNYEGGSLARRMTCAEAIEAAESLGIDLR
jgi:ABC-type multidrug transport system ATPase subunit